MEFKTHIDLPETLKIASVQNIWNDIQQKEKPIEIRTDKLKNFDGAGFQLLMLILDQKNVENEYQINDFTKEIEIKIESYGYHFRREE